MVETMPAQKMADLVKPSLEKFLIFLGDPLLRIRVCVSDLLSRIAQNYTEVFLDESIAQTVFTKLHEHLIQDDLKVVQNIVQLLDYLAIKVPDLNYPNSFFMTNISHFISMLMQVAFKDNITFENLTVVDKCLSAIVSMAQKCLSMALFEANIIIWQEALANSSSLSKERRLQTQEGLIIAMTSSLWRVNR